MKVYFASTLDLSLKPIDAWVESAEEGQTILRALSEKFIDHSVIMRARLKAHGSQEQRQFIGVPRLDPFEVDNFLDSVGQLT